MGPMVVGRWVQWSMGSWVIFFAIVYGGGVDMADKGNGGGF